MPPLRVALTFMALLGARVANPAPALAHIDLVSPAPRAPGFPDTNLSKRPCGQQSNGRLADEVNVFRPGQTIGVVWDVYVQHVSYFRIAFDAAGDDSFSSRPSMPSDPAADDPTTLPAGEGETIIEYVEDRTGEIERVEREITLPNLTCDDCTLQIIQFTYGLPIDRATYHQCADLVLEVPLAAADDQPAEGGVDTAAGVGPDDEGESGCALNRSRESLRPVAFAWLALLFAAGLRRRSRQPAASRGRA